MTKMTPALSAASDTYELTRFNALRHGVLPCYTVLPWEDMDEYRSLLQALVTEHVPQGPTEEHLVEEMAGILWRKRRLRLAEAAAHRRGLQEAAEDLYGKTVRAALVHVEGPDLSIQVASAIRATADDTTKDFADMEEDEAMTRRALNLLTASQDGEYQAALTALRDDTRQWWKDVLACDPDELDEDEEPYTPDAGGLRRFLEGEVLPWFETRPTELVNRPLIREQAFGESLDPAKLERLGRYETHLDRKLERTLAMLLKLKELRRAAEPT
jgi:hypothetical protein